MRAAVIVLAGMVVLSPIRDGVHTAPWTLPEPETETTHETIAQRTESVAAVLDALETEPVPETAAPVPETVPETETLPETEQATETEQETTPDTRVYHFTEREQYLLLGIMMHEAGNQGVIGQALVGRCVLNRVESGRFPNDIESVLFQPGQFGPESEICKYSPNADSYAALELLENGWDESQGAFFFESGGGFSWATYLFTHGGHNFYV